MAPTEGGACPALLRTQERGQHRPLLPLSLCTGCSFILYVLMGSDDPRHTGPCPFVVVAYIMLLFSCKSGGRKPLVQPASGCVSWLDLSASSQSSRICRLTSGPEPLTPGLSASPGSWAFPARP